MAKQRYLLTLFIGWIIFSFSGALAASFEVAPTTIVLSSDKHQGVLYVTNRGSEPVNVQIEAFDWQQIDKSDRLTPSASLVVSPPLVQLPPGRKQTVRLVLKQKNTSHTQQSFRILATQLPGKAGSAYRRSVEVLLQFSVPVFSAPVATSSLQLEWGAMTRDGLQLTAHNSGTVHAKLTNITLTSASGQITKVAPNSFLYILPGASRSWKVPRMKSAAGQRFTLDAQDADEGRIHAAFAVTPGP